MRAICTDERHFEGVVMVVNWVDGRMDGWMSGNREVVKSERQTHWRMQ